MRLRWDSPWVISVATLVAAAVGWWRFGSPVPGGYGPSATGPAAAAAIAAIGSIFNGAVQLSRAAGSQQADFLLRLHDDFFFRPSLTRIRKAIEAENLSVRIEGLSDTDPRYNPPAPQSEPPTVVDADDLDDYLGYLELVESFLRRGMIDVATTHAMFAHYVSWALRDPSIAYYIDWVSRYPEHHGPFYVGLRRLDDRLTRWGDRWGWLARWVRVNPMAVSGTVIAFIFRPERFARIAAEDAYRKESRTNPPVAALQGEQREAWIVAQSTQYVRTIEAVRRSIAQSFVLLVLVVAASLGVVLLARHLGYSLTTERLRGTRLVSIGLLLWATMGRLGWGIQTFGGNTLPERANLLWFRLLYLVGTGLAAVSVWVEFF